MTSVKSVIGIVTFWSVRGAFVMLLLYSVRLNLEVKVVSCRVDPQGSTTIIKYMHATFIRKVLVPVSGMS